MTSDRRRADIPGVETSDTGYITPDVESDTASADDSVAHQPDSTDLDDAFHEDDSVDTLESDPTDADASENLVDRQLGIISRMPG